MQLLGVIFAAMEIKNEKKTVEGEKENERQRQRGEERAREVEINFDEKKL